MHGFRTVVRWFRAEPRNIFDVFKYTEAMCNIFGINLYRYRGDPINGAVELSVWQIGKLFLMNVLLIVVSVINFLIPGELLNNGSMIVTYVMRTLFVGGVLGVSLMSIIHALNWRSLAILFQKLHQLDMRQILRVFVSGTTVFVIIILAFNCCTLMLVENRTVAWSLVFGQIYFNSVYFTIISLFVTVSYLISVRYQHLNNLMKLHLDTSNDNLTEVDRQTTNQVKLPPSIVHRRIIIIQKMAEVHSLLNDIASHVNKNYGDFILLNITGAMQYTGFNLFALVKIFFINISHARIITYFNVIGSLFYMTMFTFIIIRSRLIAQESKFTGTLLHKAINNETSSEMIHSMIVFSRQVRYRSAVICSRQIQIDWPFVFNVRQRIILNSKVQLLIGF
uniref:Gustatory receptor n=1 Tax=Anopheles albimanus TaxID=7167 RepID=A0A182G0E5_ANOAL